MAAGSRSSGAGAVELRGEIIGSLRLDGLPPLTLTLGAAVEGNVEIAMSLAGDLTLTSKAHVRGALGMSAHARIPGTVWLTGDCRVDGDLSITDEAEIGGSIRVTGQACVGRSLALSGRAVVGRHVGVDDGARIGHNIRIFDQASVVGDIWLGDEATVEGILAINGVASVSGGVLIFPGSQVTTIRLSPGARVDGGINIAGEGTALSAVDLRGTVAGDVTLDRRVAAITFLGSVEGAVRITPPDDGDAEPTALRSVRRARFGREVHIGDGVSIVDCDFRQCGDLDKLEFVGADLFAFLEGARARELANPPADGIERVPDGEMASIYRQLRVNLEGKGNRPASAFFYRGEMDSRRRAAGQQRRWAEWAWLSLYRIVAGYGLRVAPPLLWFLAVWAAATAVFLLRGLVVLHGDTYVSASWWQAASFSLQSMLSVFRPPDALLGLGTTVVQVGLRLVGPVLLGLAAFAVRDKVAR